MSWLRSNFSIACRSPVMPSWIEVLDKAPCDPCRCARRAAPSARRSGPLSWAITRSVAGAVVPVRYGGEQVLLLGATQELALVLHDPLLLTTRARPPERARRARITSRGQHALLRRANASGSEVRHDKNSRQWQERSGARALADRADSIPYRDNPRHCPQEAIAKVAASIKEFGFRQAIVVDSEGVVVVGHTRLLAAKRLGLKMVPVHRRRRPLPRPGARLPHRRQPHKRGDLLERGPALGGDRQARLA